eukprot:1469825-Rhodomonas_salina.3
METEWILRQVPSWFQDGSLIKAFLDEGIPVRALFLDRVQVARLLSPSPQRCSRLWRQCRHLWRQC